MNRNIKKNSGITLVALVITIIVMIIIASISVYEGKAIIKKSKIQTLETNMLTVKAKAKAYAEEIDAKVWALSESEQQTAKEEKFTEKNMTKTTVDSEALGQISIDIKNDYDAYLVTDAALDDMGLSELKEDDDYIVIYSASDYKLMDVIYSAGVDYNGKRYYSLSTLQEVLENE